EIARLEAKMGHGVGALPAAAVRMLRRIATAIILAVLADAIDARVGVIKYVTERRTITGERIGRYGRQVRRDQVLKLGRQPPCVIRSIGATRQRRSGQSRIPQRAVVR